MRMAERWRVWAMFWVMLKTIMMVLNEDYNFYEQFSCFLNVLKIIIEKANL